MVEFKKFSAKSKKDNIKVHVYMPGYKILGTIHLPIGGRLTDFLNTKGLGSEGEIFIPVTDASIHDISKGELIQYVSFISINKEQILFILPDNDQKD